IRGLIVTGVQTCALPILSSSIRLRQAPGRQPSRRLGRPPLWLAFVFSACFGMATIAAVFAGKDIRLVGPLAGLCLFSFTTAFDQIGRASCREREGRSAAT